MPPLGCALAEDFNFGNNFTKPLRSPRNSIRPNKADSCRPLDREQLGLDFDELSRIEHVAERLWAEGF